MNKSGLQNKIAELTQDLYLYKEKLQDVEKELGFYIESSAGEHCHDGTVLVRHVRIGRGLAEVQVEFLSCGERSVTTTLLSQPLSMPQEFRHPVQIDRRPAVDNGARNSDISESQNNTNRKDD